MKPWQQVTPVSLCGIRGVFTDIDDTLTTDGQITAEALCALRDLKAAGLAVIPITGRPIGWSEPCARQWPVDAVVAENGSAAWVPRRNSGGNQVIFSSHFPHLSTDSLSSVLSKIYQDDAATRASHFTQLQACLADIEAHIPGAQRSQDSPGRETDIAIDHSEFTHLSDAQIAQVVHRMHARGLKATVSSIHINGWIGEHNKLSGAHWIVRRLFGRDLAQEQHQWLYVGDSSNDQVMFEAFDWSIGVANIRRFEAQLTHPPKYITSSERGAGFAEVVAKLLHAQAGQRCQNAS